MTTALHHVRVTSKKQISFKLKKKESFLKIYLRISFKQVMNAFAIKAQSFKTICNLKKKKKKKLKTHFRARGKNSN